MIIDRIMSESLSSIATTAEENVSDDEKEEEQMRSPIEKKRRCKS